MLSDEQKKLVEDNINLAFYFIKKNKLSMDDVDLCYIGLCKAAKTFNKNKGFQFTTYAYSCIYNTVFNFYRKYNRVLSNEILISSTIKEDENETDILDYTPSVESVYNNIMFLDVVNNVKDFIDKLSKEDALIFTNLINNDKTQLDLASSLGVSQAYISRRAKYLRNLFKNTYYKDISFDDIKEEIWQRR